MKEFIKKLLKEALGEPMVLDIVKNPEKAPYMGSRFGQDVEPTGTYVLKSWGKTPEGWLEGKVTIQKPLIIDVNDNTLVSYKIDLAKQYKAKGKMLTQKLMNKGYDALITRKPDGDFGEIVLFPNSKFMLH